MLEKNSTQWTKQNIRSLRLRLGWSKSDLALRMKCTTKEIEDWEQGTESLKVEVISQLEMISRQAEACSQEVQKTPVAESQCDQGALSQIDFTMVDAKLE